MMVRFTIEQCRNGDYHIRDNEQGEVSVGVGRDTALLGAFLAQMVVLGHVRYNPDEN